jgi:hypothetical protein
MARVFRRWRSRRLRRVGFVLLGVAVLGGIVAWWRPSWDLPQLGWTGTEQASWVVGIVSGLLGAVAGTVALWQSRPRV